MTTTTKTCKTCQLTKPTTDYYVSRDRKDGLNSSCEDCIKARQAAWYKRAHPNSVLRKVGPKAKINRIPKVEIPLTPEEQRYVDVITDYYETLSELNNRYSPISTISPMEDD
jgi:hypothetical protein